VQVGVVAAATFAAFTWISGVGFGWLAALGAPGTVRSFLSLSTTLGVGAGQTGLLMGLGDHTQAALDVMQPVGTLIGATVALAIMWQCWQRRINPVLGLGMAMMAFVLLAPVIQPWYLLWAALPLAAATADPRYRKATIALTVLFSVTIMPNGATIPVYVIVQAVVVAAIVVGAAYYLLRRVGLPVSLPPGSDDADSDPGTAPAGPASKDTVDDAGTADAAAYPRSL
jgi:alpha-1,6-mannosyltransferase